MTISDVQPPFFKQMTLRTEAKDGERYLLAFKRFDAKQSRDYWLIQRVEVMLHYESDNENAKVENTLLLDDGDELDEKFHDADFYIHLENQ